MLIEKISKPVLLITFIPLVLFMILFYTNHKVNFKDIINKEGFFYFNKGEMSQILNEESKEKIYHAFVNSFDTYSLIIDPKDIKRCLEHEQVIQINYHEPIFINMVNFPAMNVKTLYVIIESELFPKGSIISVDENNLMKVWAVDWMYIKEALETEKISF